MELIVQWFWRKTFQNPCIVYAECAFFFFANFVKTPCIGHTPRTLQLDEQKLERNNTHQLTYHRSSFCSVTWELAPEHDTPKEYAWPSPYCVCCYVASSEGVTDSCWKGILDLRFFPHTSPGRSTPGESWKDWLSHQKARALSWDTALQKRNRRFHMKGSIRYTALIPLSQHESLPLK